MNNESHINNREQSHNTYILTNIFINRNILITMKLSWISYCDQFFFHTLMLIYYCYQN